MKFWLLKTEPSLFSIDDLCRSGVEPWDGIRNYQARNLIRDEMSPGDPVLIYHSRDQPIGLAGEGVVASEPYADPTQFEPESKYYDPKSDPAAPRWVLVDIRFVRRFPRLIPLNELKITPGLETMMVTRRGMRLSIQPVTSKEWQVIQRLADSPMAESG